jgi:carboxyl-terminal processing protease
VGEKTFGKGSVQELIDLSDGSAVKITVAKWFTPNGNQINGEGLEADIKIVNDEKTEADEQLIRAEEYIVKGQ